MIKGLWFVLVCGLSSPALSDTLTELPAQRSTLSAMPAQRLDDLDGDAAARIRTMRKELQALVARDDVTATMLADGYGRLSALYAAHRLFAGAELGFANAQALEPQRFRWAYYAGHVALEQGEARQALTHFARAAELKPDYPALLLRRGHALLGLNRLEEARGAFDAVYDVKGLEAAALYGLAQIDLLQRSWEPAAERLQRVLTLQPDASAARYPLAQALLRLDRRDEARAQLTARGERQPDYEDPLIAALRDLQRGARYYFEQGLSAARQQDYAASASAFAQGLEEAPENHRARTSYARALWLTGREQASKEALIRVLADAPAETLPRFLLGIIEDAEGATEKAQQHYEAVLVMDAAHPGALSYLANLHLRQGDVAEAVARFDQAVAAGVSEQPLLLHYWGALRRNGTDDQELRAHLEAFDRRYPEPPVFRFLLAKLMATSDDPGVADREQAVELMDALYRTEPIPPYAEGLALARAAAGDFDGAAGLQDMLVEQARAMGAWAKAGALSEVATAYHAGRMPAEPWPLLDPMLMPPPLDAAAVMRNYPAGQPY